MIRGPYSSTPRSPALALRLLGALVVALGLLATLAVTIVVTRTARRALAEATHD